jgi:hypothetical protein
VVLAAGWLWHKHPRALGFGRTWDRYWHVLTTPAAATAASAVPLQAVLCWYADDRDGRRPLGSLSITAQFTVAARPHHSRDNYFELATPALVLAHGIAPEAGGLGLDSSAATTMLPLAADSAEGRAMWLAELQGWQGVAHAVADVDCD